MRKSLCIMALLGLCACVKTTESGSGLTRLYSEPKDCVFVYTLDSVVTNYSIEDAYNYVEKSILEQNNFVVDSYYIVEENVLDNADRSIFGPEHMYKFRVKVYRCNK